MLIVVGSDSERKQRVCRETFARFFPGQVTPESVLRCAAESGVPPTPHGEQTFAGARNRAWHSRRHGPADFYVGLESGLVERHGQLFEEAWACVLAADGREYAGYSSGLRVPDGVARRMRESGRAHHQVMEEIERELALPHDTWSNYTEGVLVREVSLHEALRNAVVLIASGVGSLYRL
jgi:non-canonical (house-cleaning) NTP pyrophosphatase